MPLVRHSVARRVFTGNDPPLSLVLAGDIGSANTVTALGTSTLYTAVGADGDTQFSMQKVIGAWGSAALSLVKSGTTIIDAYMHIHGGGHNDTGNDGVLRYRFSTKTWTYAQAHSTLIPQAGSGFNNSTGVMNNGTHLVSDHAYSSLVGINSDENGGSQMLKLQFGAAGSPAIGIGQAHRFVVASNAWSSYGNSHTVLGVSPVVVKDTSRGLIRVFGYQGTWRELDYTASNPTWSSSTQTDPARGWSNTDTPCGVYDPVRDLYIGGNMLTGSNVMCAIAAGSPGGAWSALNFTGTALPTTMRSTPWLYRSDADTFVFVDTRDSPPTGVFEITPPGSNPLSNNWTVARRSFTGTSQYLTYSGIADHFGRFQYIPDLDAIAVCPWVDAPMELWWL